MDSVDALLMSRFAFWVLPMCMVSGSGLVVMSMGFPLSSVISVLIVVPGLLVSSMPTIMSAWVVVVGVRRRVVRRAAVVICFR